MATSRPLTPARSRPRWLRTRVLLWRLRVPLAALLVGAAAAVTVSQLRPPPVATIAVVVSARALHAGAVLAPGDLRAAEHLPETAPGGTAATADELVGRVLAVPVPAGLPLVEGVVAPTVIAGPPGTVVAPVRFADQGVAALLTPGSRVDVLAAAGDGSDQDGRYLARSALVLAAAPIAADASGPLDLASSNPGAPPVLLAVSPDDAAALAGAGSWASLSPVIVR
ncbi:RcpC/CpaB family pilus assembly protein [Cellulomonas chengniuliangii]|uniref:RcpC/CpaB family pilus assembly protein n=1 Tax=Cellulomonas chengniuliangii TaxID=2968084 RepID=A0ABY5L269_9CELL|nr:RcpC/CpaB family pilus assembly protein [Cellulomonas chengniuliangii]MCC2307169.1 SAF domain-containing protein [Cellulomonas chengniuliangii]UUI76035.1 RcpC/CpaB family pilus assembly protein [Cellulomonas chengniuliangii]